VTLKENWLSEADNIEYTVSLVKVSPSSTVTPDSQVEGDLTPSDLKILYYPLSISTAGVYNLSVAHEVYSDLPVLSAVLEVSSNYTSSCDAEVEVYFNGELIGTLEDSDTSLSVPSDLVKLSPNSNNVTYVWSSTGNNPKPVTIDTTELYVMLEFATGASASNPVDLTLSQVQTTGMHLITVTIYDSNKLDVKLVNAETGVELLDETIGVNSSLDKDISDGDAEGYLYLPAGSYALILRWWFSGQMHYDVSFSTLTAQSIGSSGGSLSFTVSQSNWTTLIPVVVAFSNLSYYKVEIDIDSGETGLLTVKWCSMVSFMERASTMRTQHPAVILTTRKCMFQRFSSLTTRIFLGAMHLV